MPLARSSVAPLPPAVVAVALSGDGLRAGLRTVGGVERVEFRGEGSLGVDRRGDVVGGRGVGATKTYSVLAAPPLLPVSPWTLPMSAAAIERGAVVRRRAFGAVVVRRR